MIARAAAVLLLVAGAAHAQSGAVGAALGAPAKSKVAAPAAVPAVQPGAEKDQREIDRVAALTAAIEAGDVRAALAAGGAAADIAILVNKKTGRVGIDPETAVFVRAGEAMMLVSGDGKRRTGTWSAEFRDYVPPGGIESLPTEEEALGPINRTPRPAPTP